MTEQLDLTTLGEEYDVKTIGDWDSDLVFEFNEACSLIYQEVIAISDLKYLPNPPIEHLGVIVGVIDVNDEVELLVRFPHGIENLCKTEFCGDYILVEKLNS